MKLTIIHTGKPERTLDELVRCGENFGFAVEVLKITKDIIQFNQIDEKIGDAVLWRLSDIGFDGVAIFQPTLIDKITINPAMSVFPETASKFFQQGVLLYSDLSDYHVDTFVIANKDDVKKYISIGKLKYPVVVKPSRGASSKGLGFIKNAEELEMAVVSGLVQPYIESDAEWRVFVVGGVSIGAMRKVARQDQVFNSSEGAIFSKEEDETTLQEINKLACRASSLFLSGCNGVDIIREKQSGKYKILEVNLAPGWQNGWDRVTGEDVPREVMQWYLERYEMRKMPLHEAIERYLRGRLGRLTKGKQADILGILDGGIKQYELPVGMMEKAEELISPLGNFLVDLHDRINMSTMHNLEDAGVLNAKFVMSAKAGLEKEQRI
ncbi:MAG: ATP-grasp domain-containing protein [Candidatus Nomurabacteria bacterium]|jgi:hypothetical protein|nr:ATP-grasp domain-containing protein [Candidatus Nomurabacteria bacterium]